MPGQLNFTMQHQQQTNWCWAAVSSSVSHFYNAGSPWSQCKIANSELGRADCCGSGASGPCNQDGYLDVALGITGNLKSWTGGTESYATVENQINGQHPLCVRIGWSGGGGHFIALTGYFDLNFIFFVFQLVTVDDPWYGRSIIPYSTVVSSYQGSGSWTHSYFTKA
jgi:hypothetical protein